MKHVRILAILLLIVVVLLTPAAVDAQTPATLDGKIVFQQANGGPIFTVNVDGTALTRVGAGMDPSWSPDGTQITYANLVPPRGIYVMNADGSRKQRIFDASEPRSPRWSPDGTSSGRIVFTRRTEKLPEREECVTFGVPGVFTQTFCFDVPPYDRWVLGLVAPDGSDFRELTAWPGAKAPTWHPDGEHIIYSSGQGVHQTNRQGTLGYDPHLPYINALTTDTSDTDPELSPDGRYLVTQYWQHDHWEIHRVDLQTGQRRRLTKSPLLADPPHNNVSPTWSPDGRHILFVSDRSGQWGFYVMNADGSNQRPILQNVTAAVPLTYDFAGEQVADWTK